MISIYWTLCSGKDEHKLTRALVHNILTYHQIPLSMLSKTEQGKPILASGQFISWSHSDRCIVIAFSNTHLLGIDVEKIGTINWKKMSQRLDKCSQSSIMSSHQKKLEFYKIWTQKEATAKHYGYSVWQELRRKTPKIALETFIFPCDYVLSVTNPEKQKIQIEQITGLAHHCENEKLPHTH